MDYYFLFFTSHSIFSSDFLTGTDPSRVQLRTRSRFPTPNGHSMCHGKQGGWHLFSENLVMGMRFLGPAVFFFLHGFLLHMKAVDNVNTIIAPTLVGKDPTQ
ncbi:hypothetical protein AAZX31_16G092800 [Glycine max]|nr:hypothetical protein GLYMA_16G100866v4 [Glycine max]KAH1150786.1 hypothetical protein GYH30_044687 [Glycine max]